MNTYCDMFDDNLKSFYDNVEDIKTYISKIKKTEFHSSTVSYNAIIISLYSNYETYVRDMYLTYIKSIMALRNKSIIPKKIINTILERFSIAFGSRKTFNIDKEKAYESLKGALENYSTNSEFDEIMIGYATNFKIGKVSSFFKDLGIDDFINKILQNDTFKEFFVETIGITNIIEYNNNAGCKNKCFEQIDRIVSERNSVAHTWKIDNRIAINNIETEYIDFLKILAQAINEIIKTEYNSIKGEGT